MPVFLFPARVPGGGAGHGVSFSSRVGGGPYVLCSALIQDLAAIPIAARRATVAPGAVAWLPLIAAWIAPVAANRATVAHMRAGHVCLRGISFFSFWVILRGLGYPGFHAMR